MNPLCILFPTRTFFSFHTNNDNYFNFYRRNEGRGFGWGYESSTAGAAADDGRFGPDSDAHILARKSIETRGLQDRKYA